MPKSIQKSSALFAIIKKDFSLFFLRGGGIGQSILLGLLLIFVFSLSQGIGEKVEARALATLFWLASAFAMVLIFNSLHALEEHNQAKSGLHLMPSSIHIVWIAKMLCGIFFMFTAQIVFFFALVVFCNAQLYGSLIELLTFLLLIDIGMATCGALLGALAVGQTGKESLLSIVLFPLLTPLLLAGIEAFSLLFMQHTENVGQSWLFLALAFDGIFLAMALILFPFLYSPIE